MKRCLAVLSLLAGCHSGLPGGATLSGRVVVGDETALGGITVHADGVASATTTTDGEGRYSFELAFGDYTISATVRSTVEATRSLSLTVDRTLGAPDLTFTPAGGLEGRVTRGGKMTGNAGIFVSVDGTSGVGVSDDAGGYHIELVPVGSYTVRAQAQGFRPGSVAGQTVRWGEVTEVPELDLVIAPGHASLRGTALLFGRDDSSGTEVEVVGTGLTATTAGDGTWAIDGVPEGTWALHFSNPASGNFDETVSQVEALVGSDGFVIDESLYSLPESPLTLFDARRIVSVQDGASFQLASDGARILYSGKLDAYPDSSLFTITLDGTVAMLADNFFNPDDYGQFAPDGQSVAFEMSGQLFTVPAAGGTPALLLRGVQGFQYSPGSSELAWFGPDPVTGTRAMGAVPVQGGMSRQLFSDPNLFATFWNAQGTRVFVYVNVLPDSSPGFVQLLGTDGSSLLKVTSASMLPRIRADNRGALFSVGPTLVTVDFDAATATTIASSFTGLYGYAGDRVVYADAGTLYSVPFAGGMPAALGAIGTPGEVMISDDGSTVGFTNGCTNQVCKVWKVAAAGGTPTLAGDMATYYGFSLSPNGGLAGYETGVDDHGIGNLWVGGDGQPARQIDSGVYFDPPRFSHDGTHILYYKAVIQQSNSQIATLFIAPTAGGAPVQLAQDVMVDPASSPDGQKLAIVRHPPSGEQILLVAPADGGAPVPILDGLAASAWTSKSALVALRSGGVAPYRFQNGFYVK